MLVRRIETNSKKLHGIGGFPGSERQLALCRSRLQRDSNDGKELSRSKRDLQEAIETFRAARKIAPHAGIVKRVLRLFDELAKCDPEGLLEGVREAVEGKE